MREWTDGEPDKRLDPIVRRFSLPLLFEPGEGWAYGASIYWTCLLITRLTGRPLAEFIQESIFDPLGMTSTTYRPQEHPNLCSRLLSMVKRDPVTGHLSEAVGQGQEPMSSISDLTAILADLISLRSKLLSKESIDLFFTPQLAPGTAALSQLRADTDDYAAPAGIPRSRKEPRVSYTLAGLLVQEEIPLSHMPLGTVLWSGMPNVIWAMNREKGLAMLFATQLLPVDDEHTVDIAMTFFRETWKTYGNLPVRF